MKLVLAVIGSLGEVRPHIILGRELSRRGHTVTIASFSMYEKEVRAGGLNFHALPGDGDTLIRQVMHAGMNPLKYWIELDHAAKTIIDPMLKELLSVCDGADALIGTFMGSVLYSVAEKYHIPYVQTQFSSMDPNSIMPMGGMASFGGSVMWNRLSYMIGYLAISVLERRYLQDWRRTLGVRQRSISIRPDYNCDGQRVATVYACSPHVVTRPDNWDEKIYMTGFLWASTLTKSYTPTPELREFLQNGSKPICISFGATVSPDMDAVFRCILQALEQNHLRAIVLGNWDEKYRHLNSHNVLFAGRAPLDWVFEHCSAVVHNGSVTLTSASLHAGLPTLVIPFGVDQPFWAARVYDCGCGPKPIDASRLSVRKLSEALAELVDPLEYYAVRAKEVSVLLSKEHGVQNAAKVIEHEIKVWGQSAIAEKTPDSFGWDW